MPHRYAVASHGRVVHRTNRAWVARWVARLHRDPQILTLSIPPERSR